ncbi:translation initiation factor eIF2B subunit gamma-like [Sycon ciliatum]|uniref:translation initiation factor eIF2B subunit gamma-like n=1 Tax=Sycon ciliatum TaxID=27933 RepID=UPI0031F6438D
MEFQAVIMAAGRGLRMGCLTSGTPKALLPLGHYPLLYYPAKLLERSGFEEAILIVPASQKLLFTATVSKLGLNLKFEIAEVNEDDDLGTADALRLIAPRIKTDVLVVSCDFISDLSLQRFADKHRRHDSSATALLAPTSLAFANMDKAKVTGTNSQELIIGLDPADDLLAVFVDKVDVEGEHLSIGMNLLRQHPHIRLENTLYDGHLYFFKKWIVDYVCANTSLKSIQGDLLPLLVKKQFQKPAARTPLASSGANTPTSATSSRAEARGDVAAAARATDIHSFVPKSSWADLARALPGSMPGEEGPEGHYTCYAHVLSQGHCVRSNTLPLYSEVARTLSQMKGALGMDAVQNIHPPVVMKDKSQACSESIIAEHCNIGESCSIKKSTIGQHCKIGDKVRITNSIIMDHVTIEDNCNLHNTIVCPNAYINDQCVLTNCQVGKRFTIATATQAKNETLCGDLQGF